MISVVVPVRDEELTVERLYDELAQALSERGEPWEVVFVDDGSRDGTHAALVRLHASAPNIRVVRLRRNLGKAAAAARKDRSWMRKVPPGWTPPSGNGADAARTRSARRPIASAGSDRKKPAYSRSLC